MAFEVARPIIFHAVVWVKYVLIIANGKMFAFSHCFKNRTIRAPVHWSD